VKKNQSLINYDLNDINYLLVGGSTREPSSSKEKKSIKLQANNVGRCNNNTIKIRSPSLSAERLDNKEVNALKVAQEIYCLKS